MLRISTGFTPECRSNATKAEQALMGPGWRGVAGKNQPKRCVVPPKDELEHLQAADLARLIHDDCSSLRQSPELQEAGHRLGRRKASLRHVFNLLTFRSQNHHGTAALFHLLH